MPCRWSTIEFNASIEDSRKTKQKIRCTAYGKSETILPVVVPNQGSQACIDYLNSIEVRNWKQIVNPQWYLSIGWWNYWTSRENMLLLITHSSWLIPVLLFFFCQRHSIRSICFYVDLNIWQCVDCRHTYILIMCNNIAISLTQHCNSTHKTLKTNIAKSSTHLRSFKKNIQ